MKVSDWIRFNEGVFRIDDLVVKVFRKCSVNSNDIALTSTMKLIDIAQMFGEYTLMFVNFANSTTNDSWKTLCLGIYYDKEDQS